MKMEDDHNSDDLVEKVEKKQRKEKNVLTFEQRIQVIMEYQHCPSARILSEKYGCGKTQILNIMRNKQEYLEQWNQDIPQHPVRPSGLFLSLGVILNEWIKRAKTRGKIITDNDIRRTGKEISIILNIPSFQTSNRWLLRFKTKFNITDDYLSKVYYQASSTKRKSLKIEDIIVDIKDSLSPQVLIPVRPNTSTKNISSNTIVRRLSTPLHFQSSDSNDNSTSDNNIPIITSVTSMNRQFERHNKHKNKSKKENDGTVEYVDIFSESNHSNGNNDETENTVQNSEELSCYKDALEFLKSIEDFAVSKEDVRAIGLINQLENYLKERVVEEQ